MPRAKKESPYAQALLSELIANSYLIQKKLNQAEPYLKTIVQLNALQPDSQRSIIQELATVYLSNKNYNGAIRLYKQVLDQDAKNKVQPGPDLYYRLGLAYSYRGDADNSNKSDYSTALQYVKQAIQMAEKLHAKDPKNNDAPSKDWYQSWFVMAYKLKDFKQARDVAQLLVTKWPNDKDFWSYYANTALLLHDDQQAAAIYGLMYKRGMLKSKDDYMQLASLLLEQRTPYKAAEIITDGMQKGIVPKTKDNYDTLSGAWTAARAWDKALAALGQEAGLSSDGKVYLRQAQIYLNRRNYAKAHEAAQNALNKGGLKNDTGSAWMTLGQAAFEQKDYSAAVKAFRQAEKYKSQAQNARSWIKYVASMQQGG
ncbi:MAG: tetratricopeptide repeat protein [Gammaproteobacteria bacterium]